MKNNFWNENVEPWTQVVDSGAIASRHVTSPAIIKAITDFKLASVLDVGCGEGWIARALPPQTQYVGIDGSEGLIKKAKDRSRHSFETVSYEQFAQGLWKAPQSFQGIVFNYSLLDENLSPILKRAKSLLMPEGNILIQTLHPCFKMPKYEDGWNTEDFKMVPVAFKDTMPWFGRTMASWIDLFAQSELSLEKLIEPKIDGTPISVIFILKAKAG